MDENLPTDNKAEMAHRRSDDRRKVSTMKILTVSLRSGPLEMELTDEVAARTLLLLRSPIGREINCLDVHGEEWAFLAGHVDGHRIRTKKEEVQIDPEDAKKIAEAKVGETVTLKPANPATKKNATVTR